METLPGSSKGLHQQKNATDMAGPSNGTQKLNGMQHRATPSVGFSLPPETLNSKTELSTMEEEDEGLDDAWDNELSAEAQAHNISMFLSSSNSDSGK